MPNQYLNSFEVAAQNFEVQAERPGYKRGWFTWLRHNTRNHPAIEILREALQKCESNEGAKRIIELFFKKYAQFSNHSFSTYFLDELLKDFPDESWHKYQPKPIIFFQGTVYRGTNVPPEIVFQQGFSDLNPSKNLDDYVSDCNGSVGVSTSKSLQVAVGYALPMVRVRDFDCDTTNTYGYIYKINCRSISAVDIEETQSKRGNYFRASLAKAKAEVNVIGHIRPCDVMMAWKVHRDKTIPVEIVTNDDKYLDNKEREADKTIRNILVPHRDFPQSFETKSGPSSPSNKKK